MDNWICRNTLDLNKEDINENIYKWLVMPKNLTETIKKTGATFSLNLLQEGFDSPHIDEEEALKDCYDNDSLSFIRKVILEGNNKPVIFARVTIPNKTYLNYKNKLEMLGNKPIGNAILYNDDQVSRQEFEYKLLKNGDQLFNEVKSFVDLDEEFLCARRSVFILPKGSMLITEVFLSEIPTYPL